MAFLNNLTGMEPLMLEKKKSYSFDEVKRLMEEVTSKTVQLLNKDDNVLFRVALMKKNQDSYDVVFENIQVKEKTETEDELFEHFAQFAAICNEFLKNKDMSYRWNNVRLDK